ncbi:MAG TPA: glycosyltransferase family 4 protein, partial [Bacteroidia bacterium]
ICLAPLRFGAGLKGKLVEAMQCGTPSVTTSVGAEAMHGDLPWSGAIADNPGDIANSAVQLYINEKSWHKAQLNGIEILDREFNSSQHKVNLLSKIELVMNTLAEHRLHNFTGAMLMHHTISGTKYMSKWIEEKNREF